MIVRGATNVPIVVGDMTLPPNARMNLFVVNQTFNALDFVTVANVPSGPGVHFMHTLAVQSENLNFLEGCFHMYSDANPEFPVGRRWSS